MKKVVAYFHAVFLLNSVNRILRMRAANLKVIKTGEQFKLKKKIKYLIERIFFLIY